MLSGVDIRGLSPRATCGTSKTGSTGFPTRPAWARCWHITELYKSILTLPGDVLDLGVYKAASAGPCLATFREMLEKRPLAAESWASTPSASFRQRRWNWAPISTFIDRFEAEGGPGLDVTEVSTILEAKGFRNITLEKGNVFDTLPDYLTRNPQTPHRLPPSLDMDVKEPDRVRAGATLGTGSCPAGWWCSTTTTRWRVRPMPSTPSPAKKG